MITFKTLTKEDLKKDYSTRHGFVFIGPVESSDRAIIHLCDTLIQHKVTKELPEFVVRLDNLTTAFVYRDDFDSPPFFYYADIATRMGICKIDQLCNYLK